MNRLRMLEEIAKRVPMLAHRDKDDWKHAEQLRAQFVADYPLRKISALTLDEFVIGNGPENHSFCYRLEQKMDTLGKIVGATALKFGVYFGRTKSEASNRYRFARCWGSTVEGAFRSVKEAIAALLQAAADGNSEAIAENRLSTMFKGKILFVYHPDEFAPIYSKKHLKHFITELDLSGSCLREVDMQRTLMAYRAAWPDLVAQHPALYMRLLYDIFDYPPENDAADAPSLNVPILDEAIKGAEFIPQMPALPVAANAGDGTRRKVDHEKQARSWRRIGDRGEALVLAKEIARLTQAGRPELALRIKHVSQEDDSAGYDILSFDEDGTERPIEVKATSGGNLARGFYISSNEVEKAKALSNWHLYIVFSAMSRHPQILRLKHPALKDFLLRPVVYHATVPPRRAP